jgi:uncharacterized LabA/DUF88 family protein
MFSIPRKAELLTDQRLKLAVFIDFDNIEIGVRNTLHAAFDPGVVLEALKERGEVVSKVAYSDWKRAGDYSRALSQHAIKMVQRNLTPGGDKNGADINLALDALEMAFTHDHINAYVIVGGDSDFISLVEKLKQYDKKVFVVGGRSFTSQIMQRNCHEFIAYENLVGAQTRRTPARGRQPAPAAAGQLPVAQALPLVRRALEVLADREVSPQLGLLKSTLLQLDSTFSERSYGVTSFRDFAEKLAAAGLVALKHSGRNVNVELKDGAAADESAEVETAPVRADARPEPRASEPASSPEPPRVADAIRFVRRAFETTSPPRWPLYLRNVKQALRAADAGFDERRFGFTGLNDLVRACQREGIFRVERDRQGAMRVFQGPALQHPSAPAAIAEEPIEAEVVAPAPEAVEAGQVEPADDAAPEAAMEREELSAVEAAAAKPARRRRAAGSAPRKPRRPSSTPRPRKAAPVTVGE